MPETAPDTTLDDAESTPSTDVPSTDTPVGVHPAEFPEMTTSASAASELPLNRFLDVTLNASVELGRAVMSIGEVLKLGEGAVVELDRDVTEPVDIFIQGVRLARGEVVIVDDTYAVRITHVESGQLGQMHPASSPTAQEEATA